MPRTLSSKDRAALRALAQNLSPVVMVGREGFSGAVTAALSEALEAHELVKVKFQANKDETETISRALEKATGSNLVAVTGFTAVFYKESSNPEKQKHLI